MLIVIITISSFYIYLIWYIFYKKSINTDCNHDEKLFQRNHIPEGHLRKSDSQEKIAERSIFGQNIDRNISSYCPPINTEDKCTGHGILSKYTDFDISSCFQPENTQEDCIGQDILGKHTDLYTPNSSQHEITDAKFPKHCILAKSTDLPLNSSHPKNIQENCIGRGVLNINMNLDTIDYLPKNSHIRPEMTLGNDIIASNLPKSRMSKANITLDSPKKITKESKRKRIKSYLNTKDLDEFVNLYFMSSSSKKLNIATPDNIYEDINAPIKLASQRRTSSSIKFVDDETASIDDGEYNKLEPCLNKLNSANPCSQGFNTATPSNSCIIDTPDNIDEDINASIKVASQKLTTKSITYVDASKGNIFVHESPIMDFEHEQFANIYYGNNKCSLGSTDNISIPDKLTSKAASLMTSIDTGHGNIYNTNFPITDSGHSSADFISTPNDIDVLAMHANSGIMYAYHEDNAVHAYQNNITKIKDREDGHSTHDILSSQNYSTIHNGTLENKKRVGQSIVDCVSSEEDISVYTLDNDTSEFGKDTSLPIVLLQVQPLDKNSSSVYVKHMKKIHSQHISSLNTEDTSSIDDYKSYVNTNCTMPSLPPTLSSSDADEAREDHVPSSCPRSSLPSFITTLDTVEASPENIDNNNTISSPSLSCTTLEAVEDCTANKPSNDLVSSQYSNCTNLDNVRDCPLCGPNNCSTISRRTTSNNLTICPYSIETSSTICKDDKLDDCYLCGHPGKFCPLALKQLNISERLDILDRLHTEELRDKLSTLDKLDVLDKIEKPDNLEILDTVHNAKIDTRNKIRNVDILDKVEHIYADHTLDNVEVNENSTRAKVNEKLDEETNALQLSKEYTALKQAGMIRLSSKLGLPLFGETQNRSLTMLDRSLTRLDTALAILENKSKNQLNLTIQSDKHQSVNGLSARSIIKSSSCPFNFCGKNASRSTDLDHLPSPDSPRLAHKLTPEDECESLLFENGVLVSGSLDALVAHAIPRANYYPDDAFLWPFLLSIRLFMPPHLLLATICKGAFNQGTKSKEMPLLVRNVVKLLTAWSEIFPYDFRDEEMMGGVRNLTHASISAHAPVRRDVTQALHNLLNRLTELERYEDSLTKLSSTSFSEADAALDIVEANFCPLKVAEQLTFIELEKLSFIGPEEFVQAFAKDNLNPEAADYKKTNNLECYVQWFNRLSYLVATQACSPAKKKQRARAIEAWIEVARECFNIGNFNSLMAIIAGLNMAPVARLKKTWNKIQTAKFAILEHQMDPSSNFSSYRSTLKAAKWRSEGAVEARRKVVIPFFSLLVKDLYFVNEGCVNRLPNGYINFSKFRQLWSQVNEFLGWKEVNCPFAKDPALVAYLQTVPVLGEADWSLKFLPEKYILNQRKWKRRFSLGVKSI